MHQTSAARRTAPKSGAKFKTFEDVLAALGNISPRRVRFDVKPGRATVRDLIHHDRMSDTLCELIDGFLVEKAMGNKEGFLSMRLGWYLQNYLEVKDLGYVCGAEGMFRFKPGLVRLPDVAFTPWSKLPGGVVPDEPVPYLVPDLAVEILSETNTKAEIDRKLKEFFEAGVRVTWVIDPKTRTAQVYTSPTDVTALTAADSLDGGDVLPGFKLPLARLFAKLGPARKGQRKGK